MVYDEQWVSVDILYIYPRCADDTRVSMDFTEKVAYKQGIQRLIRGRFRLARHEKNTQIRELHSASLRPLYTYFFIF